MKTIEKAKFLLNKKEKISLDLNLCKIPFFEYIIKEVEIIPNMSYISSRKYPLSYLNSSRM